MCSNRFAVVGRWEAKRILDGEDEEDLSEDREEDVLYYHLDGRLKVVT